MQFLHNDEETKVVFSLKERLQILFKGFFKLNHLNSYRFSCHLMEIAKRSFEKHGDITKHGQIDSGESIEFKK